MSFASFDIPGIYSTHLLITHELRSPLSSIISLHQLILQGLTDSPQETEQFIQDSYHCTQTLLRSLETVVMISNQTYGDAGLVSQKIRLHSLIRELEILIALPIKNRNLRLEIVPIPETLAVRVDRQKFLWLLRNLIDGGILASKKAVGSIQLKAQAIESNQVQINLVLPCPSALWRLDTESSTAH